MNKRRNKLGFTLAELLIVVAIIGVLVAIAIPVFTSQLEKAREAVCLSNRTSLQHMLTYDVMMDKDAWKDVADVTPPASWEGSTIKSTFEAGGNSFTEKICPSGGPILVSKVGSSIFITCQKHPGSADTGPTRTDWLPGEEIASNLTPTVSEKFAEKYGGLPGDKNYIAQNDDYHFMQLYRDLITKNGTEPYPTLNSSEMDTIRQNFFPDQKQFSEEPLAWSATRLYLNGTYHDVQVLTSQDNMQKDTPLLKGYLLYYDGHYYRSNKVFNYKNSVDPINFGSTRVNNFNSVEEINANWEKVK